MNELGFLFVTQFMSLEPSKVTTQNGEEWGTFHLQFLIPQTATFCIAMDAKRNSSFAAKIKNEVLHRNGVILASCRASRRSFCVIFPQHMNYNRGNLPSIVTCYKYFSLIHYDITIVSPTHLSYKYFSHCFVSKILISYNYLSATWSEHKVTYQSY